MHFEVNTDHDVEGSEQLTRQVSTILEETFGRFGERITRIDAHFRGEHGNSTSRASLKSCVLEARLVGRDPIVVTHEGESVPQALHGAAERLERTITRTIGRMDHRKGGTPPYSGFSTDNRPDVG